MPKGHVGRTLLDKVCPVCQKVYQSRAGDTRKTCSRECGKIAQDRVRAATAAARSKQVERRCVTCGDLFKTKVSDRGVYCSKACMYARNDTTRACEVCGKPFRSAPSQLHVRTCSYECGLKIRDNHDQRVELQCKTCGMKFLESPSKVGRRVYCSKACQETDPEVRAEKRRRVQGSSNPNWQGGIVTHTISATGKAYTRQPLHRELAKSSARRARKLQATVAWADKDKIAWFYAQAKELTKFTGMVYHVDHIVPLTSKLVCGLHNEFNLQLLPGPENLRKQNRHWPDMP